MCSEDLQRIKRFEHLQEGQVAVLIRLFENVVEVADRLVIVKYQTESDWIGHCSDVAGEERNETGTRKRGLHCPCPEGNRHGPSGLASFSSRKGRGFSGLPLGTSRPQDRRSLFRRNRINVVTGTPFKTCRSRQTWKNLYMPVIVTQRRCVKGCRVNEVIIGKMSVQRLQFRMIDLGEIAPIPQAPSSSWHPRNGWRDRAARPTFRTACDWHRDRRPQTGRDSATNRWRCALFVRNHATEETVLVLVGISAGRLPFPVALRSGPSASPRSGCVNARATRPPAGRRS